MKKFLFFIFLFQTSLFAQDLEKVYFAGGCFWCMEESFEKFEGVSKVISGYSGGSTENPTYEEVTYSNTGHFETIEIIYDKNITSYNKILDHFWINIDPFDAVGQFCDKGYSYRSVAFFKNDEQRKLINKKKRNIEQKFNKKVVTYVIKFDKFYEAENYHQDYFNNKNLKSEYFTKQIQILG